MRVLFGLVTMRPSHANDDAAESMPVVAHLGGTDNHQGAVINHLDATSDRQGATTNCMVLLLATKVPPSTAECRQQSLGCHRRRDMLIVEAINLDILIFTTAPWWAPTIMVCDNDLQ
jgi:hypothetical protein